MSSRSSRTLTMMGSMKATRKITKRAAPPRRNSRPGKRRAGSGRAGARTTSVARRADFGSPIEGFFARQPPHLRAILDELHLLIAEAAPDATSSIKWGMPSFAVNGTMMCALGAHRAHVNLILSGPPGAFVDPERRLAGEGKTGRHLKLTSLDELPRAAVLGWLRTAARLARTER
jgi:hypothetical protein